MMDLTPGSPLFIEAAAAGGLLVIGIVLLVVAVRRARALGEAKCGSCGRVLIAEWKKCMFCGAPVAAVRAELEFISGPLKGKTMNLERDITTIGSVAGNTVLLSDTGVSRKHVGIRKVTSGGYELADLGSTNGVYCNGERVARRRLEVGDVIRVGATEIVFR
jgi:hypothetical protein